MTTCAHLDNSSHTPVPDDFAYECADCVAVGGRWVHLRRCLTCDHIACCDSSPAHHATAHNHATGHPVITSVEPGESWRWCFAHQVGA